MTDLKALLARVEEATGPDRELDVAIYEAISGQRAIRTRFGPEERGGRVVAAVTASLDAALALVERVLPGLYMWRVEFDDEPVSHPYEARVYGKSCEGSDSGKTPALALLAALLRALLALSPTGRGEIEKASVAESAGEGLRPFASDRACQSEGGSS